MKKVSDEKIRTFVAIELPQDIHDSIQKLQESLKSSMPGVRWTKYGNVHLTLKFLGDVQVSKIGAISKSIQDIAGAFSPFVMSLSGIGAFPNPRKPSVVWVGVEKGADEITNVANQIEASLEKLGFPREKRPFSPHLTIGRVREIKNPRSLSEALDQSNVGGLGEFTVEKISLVKSQLDPGGSIYTTLAEMRLKKASDSK